MDPDAGDADNYCFFNFNHTYYSAYLRPFVGGRCAFLRL